MRPSDSLTILWTLLIINLTYSQVEVEESLMKFRCGSGDIKDVIANDRQGVRQSHTDTKHHKISTSLLSS
jgi:hypothetical protein